MWSDDLYVISHNGGCAVLGYFVNVCVDLLDRYNSSSSEEDGRWCPKI